MGYDQEKNEIFQIRLERGDIFIASGDFIHAGSSYFQDNVRLHYYFDPNNREEGSRKEGVVHHVMANPKMTLVMRNVVINQFPVGARRKQVRLKSQIVITFLDTFLPIYTPLLSSLPH
jgi:hypothetical protein